MHSELQKCISKELDLKHFSIEELKNITKDSFSETLRMFEEEKTDSSEQESEEEGDEEEEIFYSNEMIKAHSTPNSKSILFLTLDYGFFSLCL